MVMQLSALFAVADSKKGQWEGPILQSVLQSRLLW